jgi:tetratricopeptide (TPR) repeat protein
VATSASNNLDNASSANNILKPISPTLRKRLQKYFGYGTQKQKEGDYDYAHAMFSQCVVADPANLLYVESMLNNLIAKYRLKKKKPKVRANRSNFKKALAEEDWTQVLKQGPEFLEQSPWDVPTLRGLATACAALRHSDERFNDIELRYLRTALDANPKDIEVNKHCAESLARMGQFDQAIACWHRIEEISPSKEGAHKQISELTVLKNMRASGLLEEEKANENSSTSQAGPKQSAKPEAAAAKKPAARAANKSGVHSRKKQDKSRTIDALEQEITQHPAEVDNYLALAKLYEAKGSLVDAESVLRRAVSVSGNDMKVNELLEAVQVRRSRNQLAKAEAQFKANPSRDHRELVQRMKVELNRLELGIYHSRAERYPEQTTYRFELAVCLKRAGNFKQAANYFKEAATEPRLLAAAMLQRGECLQQIRQYHESMRCYLKAAKAAADKKAASQNPAVEKLALYRAGVLAMGLKDQHQAQRVLEQLAAKAPNFRDVNARLDKLKTMGNT